MATYFIEYAPKKAKYSCIFELMIEANDTVDANKKFQQWDTQNEYTFIRIKNG